MPNNLNCSGLLMTLCGICFVINITVLLLLLSYPHPCETLECFDKNYPYIETFNSISRCYGNNSFASSIPNITINQNCLMERSQDFILSGVFTAFGLVGFCIFNLRTNNASNASNTSNAAIMPAPQNEV